MPYSNIICAYVPEYRLLLFNTAQRCAHQQHLSPFDAEDCAIAFVEKMVVEHLMLLEQQQRSADFAAWLNISARNHVWDFCRRHARMRRQETEWPQQENENGAIEDCEFPDTQASPCVRAMSGELSRRIAVASAEIKTESFTLLWQHYVEKQTFVELAAETGLSPDAVRMMVQHARKHLHKTLQRQGMTEEDANEYLAELARGGVGIRRNVKNRKFAKFTRSVFAVRNVLYNRSAVRAYRNKSRRSSSAKSLQERTAISLPQDCD